MQPFPVVETQNTTEVLGSLYLSSTNSTYKLSPDMVISIAQGKENYQTNIESETIKSTIKQIHDH